MHSTAGLVFFFYLPLSCAVKNQQFVGGGEENVNKLKEHWEKKNPMAQCLTNLKIF